MEYLKPILANSSLWEVMALVFVIYLLFNPKLLKAVTRLKIGELEIEMNALKREVAEGREQISELEAELESERRLFEDILDSFDPQAPLKDLASARQAIKANARSLSETDALKNYLTTEASPGELYAAAVSIRERRPTALVPDLVALLDRLAGDRDLCGVRLNTVWTLTSALHLTLISAIRDCVGPFPSEATLLAAEMALKKLSVNRNVQNDRPDNPMKGIRGPAKHGLAWVEKGLARYKNEGKPTPALSAAGA